MLLRESRADLGHRHFDFAGAASITGGLMLLVYAMTRATQHGWAHRLRRSGCSPPRSALIVAFFVIESRSKAPLLPLRIFRLRTLTASNVSGLLMGGAIFAQFFLLTLYMQQVLHYSALKTGVAYIGLTLTIIVFSGRRAGARSRGSACGACCRPGSRSRRSRSCSSRSCRSTAATSATCSRRS